MKKILLVLCSFIVFWITACNNLSENNINNSSTTQPENKTKTIYKDDNGINLFINKYNKLYNPNITSNMITKKHIAGRDRDNVVTITNDKLEINIYNNHGLNNEYNISVYVGYKKNVDVTIDDYKLQFMKFIKLFDENLSDEDINNYWNDMISTYHSSYDINDIDIVTMTNNNSIDYFKLTKDLKL